MPSKDFFIIISPKRYSVCHGYMGRKGAKACSKLLQSFAICRTLNNSSKSLDIENLLQAVHQSLCLEGLAEKAGRPAGHRFLLDAGFGAGGDHDHRQRTMANAELAFELEAVHPGHLDVGDGAGKLSKIARCEKILGRCKVAHF